MKKYMIEYAIEIGGDPATLIVSNETLAGAINTGLLLSEAFSVAALSVGKACKDCGDYHPFGGNLSAQNETFVSRGALGLN
jgi:hypothetical protein